MFVLVCSLDLSEQVSVTGWFEDHGLPERQDHGKTKETEIKIIQNKPKTRESEGKKLAINLLKSLFQPKKIP